MSDADEYEPRVDSETAWQAVNRLTEATRRYWQGGVNGIEANICAQEVVDLITGKPHWKTWPQAYLDSITGNARTGTGDEG